MNRKNQAFSHPLKGIIPLLVLMISFFTLYAQDEEKRLKALSILNERGELYFSFERTRSIPFYSRIVSIDRIEYDSVYAYANKKQFENFVKLQFPFTILTPPSLVTKLKTKSIPMEEWGEYPSYTRYVELMDSFSMAHPALCKIYEIGESPGGKKILAVKISDNVDGSEEEPEVFYSAGIHGDEGGGVVLMLRFIEYLLKNYGNDEKISHLVDNIQIYINPLSNPDGFYFLSDTSNFGSKRFNLENIDLNRNFPDPEDGEHPDVNEWQVETLEMMNFMQSHHFILSAIFHDGAEVVNYPWDTWSNQHADNDWFRYISRQYADTVHNYAEAGYFTFLNNGITNGYAWYEISGGRQDYITGFLQGREVTIELSDEKSPVGIQLQNLWESNRESLLNFLRNSLTGVKGFVTDAETGDPVHAQVRISDHDDEYSFVYSDENSGIFYRMMLPGASYTMEISANGYITAQETVTVAGADYTNLNIRLEPIYKDDFRLLHNPITSVVEISVPESINENAKISMYDLSGKLVYSNYVTLAGPEIIKIDPGKIEHGLYLVKISGPTVQKILKMEKF